MKRHVIVLLAVASMTVPATASWAAEKPKPMSTTQTEVQIQTQNSTQPTSENVRSQAEKRLETQRKDLTRNWGG